MTHFASDGSNQSPLVASGTPVPGTDAESYIASDGTLQEALPIEGGAPGGGSGPVDWADVQNKPASVGVDTRARANHTGTQTASTISDLPDLLAGKVDVVAGKGLSDTNYTQAEKTKLAGIEPLATANDTDENLRDRSTHTGTQTAATISDLPDILATKVEAVAGKTLSDTNYTQAEKAKLASLEDAHFKGVHLGVAGLTAAHPTGAAGDYGVVDNGTDLLWYQWDAAGSEWVARVGESTEVTPAQVKTYYESNPDTNAFTDSEKLALANLTTNGRFTLRRRGTWNAVTNVPELTNGTGVDGDFYAVTVGTTRGFGGRAFTFMPGDWAIYSSGEWQRLALTDTIFLVNGQTGNVNLTAFHVGAKPDSYVPAWSEVTDKPATFAPTTGTTASTAKPGNYQPTWEQVTGKPAFDTLYAPKRVLIHERTFNASNTETYTQLGSGYGAYDHLEMEFYGLAGSAGSLALHVQVMEGAGPWRIAGYVCHTTGHPDAPTQSATAFTLIPEGIGASLCNGNLTVRRNGLPVVSNCTYGDSYRNSFGRMPVNSVSSMRIFFNSIGSAHYITGGTIRVYGINR